jgi:aspartyl-tRNA synthetase
MEVATQLGLRNPAEFAPLWVIFLCWNLMKKVVVIMQCTILSPPKPEDMHLLATDPGSTCKCPIWY